MPPLPSALPLYQFYADSGHAHIGDYLVGRPDGRLAVVYLLPSYVQPSMLPVTLCGASSPLAPPSPPPAHRVYRLSLPTRPATLPTPPTPKSAPSIHRP